MIWVAQFGVREIEHGQFGEKLVGISLVVDREHRWRRPRWCSSGGGSEPGASMSPGGSGSKQLHACTHARGAARAADALDRGR